MLYTPETLRALDDDTIDRRIEALDRAVPEYRDMLGKALQKLDVEKITTLTGELTARITNRQSLIQERTARQQAKQRLRRVAQWVGRPVYAGDNPVYELTVDFKDIIGHVDFNPATQKVTIKTRALTVDSQ